MSRRAALRGLRILLTRPPGRTDQLRKTLEDLGAHVVEEPLTRTIPLAGDEYAPLDRSIENIAGYDWVLFTSGEGVRYCLRRAAEHHHASGLSALFPGSVKLAAVGPATGEALREAGRAPDLVAEDHRAEGLVAALRGAAGNLHGRRFLLVRAEKGRGVLPRELEAAGAHVDLVLAYRTVGVPEGATRAAELLGRNQVDVVVVASGAALDELASALACRRDVLERVNVAALGPVTAEHARELGFKVEVAAANAGLESLVEALLQKYGKET